MRIKWASSECEPLLYYNIVIWHAICLGKQQICQVQLLCVRNGLSSECLTGLHVSRAPPLSAMLCGLIGCCMYCDWNVGACSGWEFSHVLCTV